MSIELFYPVNAAGGVLVPFLRVGIFGWLPMLAGVAMAMSSVTVVGNSMLLGRYKPRFAAKKPKGEEIYTSDKLVNFWQGKPVKCYRR